jgi:RNA polymerase sigma-70 factor (ECF subfamily)
MPANEEYRLTGAFSDEEMITGFLQKDPKILDVLYELYFVKLCDFCHCLIGNSVDSQDIVSDLFEMIISKKARVKGPVFNTLKDIAGYLHISVRNRAFNYIKKNKTRLRVHENLKSGNLPEYSFNDELDFEYIKGLRDEKLLETLYNLPQRSIQVLRKIYLESMSYDEIATQMNISPSTVSNLRTQGIHILSKILKKDDFFVEGCLLAFTTLSTFSRF